MKLLLKSLVLVLLIPAAGEGLAALALRHPPSESWLRVARTLYNKYQAGSIQFDRSCASYDPKLFYRLRRLSYCRFPSWESTSELNMNRLGVRDDEDSLRAPEIVVLGGSSTMGLGVTQSDTYPKLLQRALGLKTLNAGMPSFGTAKQSVLFEEIEQSGLKYLLVQYSSEDVGENQAFLGHGRVLRVGQAEVWKFKSRRAEEARRYRPGKYLLGIISSVKAFSEPSPLQPRNWEEEGALFLRTLSGLTFAGTPPKIIVFEVSSPRSSSPSFSQSLNRQARDPAYPEFINFIEVLDLSESLKPEHFFPVDGHLDADGHKLVAASLAERIRTMPPPAPPASPKT